jgi:hypothetical protein
MLKKIINLLLATVLLATMLSIPVTAKQQTYEAEINGIGYSMSTYSMLISYGTTCREITMFTHSVLDDIYFNDPYYDYDCDEAQNVEKVITGLLKNELIGRNVEIVIDDSDTESIFDDKIVSWKLLPTDNKQSVEINKKYTMDYGVYNILKNYGDPELFKIVDRYFTEQKISSKNKIPLYGISSVDYKNISNMFKDDLDFETELRLNKDEGGWSFDILPTKETGYKWSYKQCREIEHLLQSKYLSDKFGFIFDYRSCNMLRFGIRDIQKSNKSFIDQVYRGE